MGNGENVPALEFARVIFSSHVMALVERLCDHVAVIGKELRLYSRSVLRSVLLISFLVGVLASVCPALSGNTSGLPFGGLLFTVISAASFTNVYGDDGKLVRCRCRGRTPGGRPAAAEASSAGTVPERSRSMAPSAIDAA